MDTVIPYVDVMAQKPIAIVEAWKQDLAQGFPCDLATLYRWFQRLAFRFTLLLTLLEKELLDLAPATSLEPLHKLIIKPMALRQIIQSDIGPFEMVTLTLHALCKSNLGLAKQLLRTTGKLLQQPCDKKLPPVLFLNFFCWQKTGQALLSPLPPKPHPPPERGLRPK